MIINCFSRWCCGVLLCGLGAMAQASVTSSPFSLTLSLISYSHFANSAATTLCVVGSSNDAMQLQKQAKLSGYNYKILSVDQSSLLKTACQAVYFNSAISLHTQNNLISKFANAEVLTFTTNDIRCESRNVFCIYQAAQQYYFKVNLDSLTLSKVRIDPRVLLLAKNSGG